MSAIKSTRIGEGLAAFLAVLALVAQIAVPPGYMVGRTNGGAGIVVCTGHGPLITLPRDGGEPHKSRRAGQGDQCVFAGHSGVGPAPLALALSQAPIAYVVAPRAVAADLRPGRGLAAPPPPCRGPPDRLI